MSEDLGKPCDRFRDAPQTHGGKCKYGRETAVETEKNLGAEIPDGIPERIFQRHSRDSLSATHSGDAVKGAQDPQQSIHRSPSYRDYLPLVYHP